jgi:hypothetical protein
MEPSDSRGKLVATTVISPLALQAPDAVQAYLRAAIVAVDTELGSGYAKAHPDLLGCFVEACTRFYEAEVLRMQVEETEND